MPEQENNEKDLKLEILSPTDRQTDERIKKYIKHIKDAFDNSEVKNLALTGVYGSGKSTIIKSFKSLYTEVKVLDVSLASFKESNDYEKFKDQIQLNILQQIIYSQNADKIPESRINRIREINLRSFTSWLKLISFLTLILAAYSLLKFYDFQLNPNNWDNSLEFSWSTLANIILFLVSAGITGISITKMLYNSKINKVSIKGEVGLSDGIENKDFLNKYIDEILYFFEKTHIDIVVIEDLDRFNTTEIYRTLREINFILNTYLKNLNCGKKKVVFLYAIKDDIFLNELDRTKFFDLIIPTIPFVNYSNSKNVLNLKLDEVFKNDKTNKPSKDFINTISSFIKDNRTLLNILNEFIVYREQQKLQNEELNPVKLLALVMYKNLRPKDFAKFHIGKSIIDIAFSAKSSFTSEAIHKYEREIAKIQENIEIIKNNNLQSIKELNTIYIYHIKNRINNNSQGLIYNEEEKLFEEIINESLDLMIYNSEEIIYYDKYGSRLNSGLKLTNIDSSLNYSYSDRYDNILNKNLLIKNYEEEIIQLRSEINNLESESLASIYNRYNPNSDEFINIWSEIYSTNNIQDDALKIHEDAFTIILLKNGYIDEDYREYITIFQKGGLNEKDHEFKINIISKIREPKALDYDLTNIDDLIQEIPLPYFEDDRILNLKLIDWIFRNEEKYPEQFKTILDFIPEWSQRTQQFILRFIYHNDYCRKILIENLSNKWDKIWITVLNSNFVEKDLRQILFLLLNDVDHTSLIELNHNQSLTNYISERADVLFDFNSEEKQARLKKILAKNGLNVKFKDLSPLVEKYDNLLQFVYENEIYVLTYDNIGTLLENRLDNFSRKEFDDNNITYIYESNLKNLINYVENNLELYIDNIYSQLSDQHDDEKHVLKVIDNKDLDINKRIEFIKKQQNKIQDLYEIGDIEFFKLVFKYDRIEATWKNVYNYFFENDNSFDDDSIKYLNIKDNYLALSSIKISDHVKKEFIDKLINKLLSNDKLTIEPYTALLNSLTPDYKIYDLDYNSIGQRKVELLINNNIIPLNDKNFNGIKSSYPGLHIKLLLRNWVDYLEYKQDNSIEVDDKVKILQATILTTPLKCSIIKNNLAPEDFNNLDLTKEVVKIILNDTSLSSHIKEALTIDKLKAILSHNIEVKQKIKLLNTYRHLLTENIIFEIRKLLPKPYSGIYPQTQLIFQDNGYNREFINILQSKGIAGKGNISKGKIRVWFKNFNIR